MTPEMVLPVTLKKIAISTHGARRGVALIDEVSPPYNLSAAQRYV